MIVNANAGMSKLKEEVWQSAFQQVAYKNPGRPLDSLLIGR